MIPKPGETAGAWWAATGAAEARKEAAARHGYASEFDIATYFLHDVPPEILAAGPEEPREEAEGITQEPESDQYEFSSHAVSMDDNGPKVGKCGEDSIPLRLC